MQFTVKSCLTFSTRDPILNRCPDAQNLALDGPGGGLTAVVHVEQRPEAIVQLLSEDADTLAA